MFGFALSLPTVGNEDPEQGEIMTKVRINFHKWNYCGGYEYWLNFKQGEHECKVKKQPSSVKGTAEMWSSEEDLQSCAKTGFNIDEKIEVQVESSDDDEFCPKQIHVWFAKDHEFHTKRINFDTIDYSDATKNPWHTLIHGTH
jgi:hypothetical protein